MPRGRRPLPWIKLWFEILGDPKMKRLSIAERGCWDGILLLAGQSPIRGKLMLTETQSMTIRDIAKALNLQNREISSLKSCISKMIELESLAWTDNNCLEVINFKKRQEVYESDIPDGELTPKKLRINSELTPIEGEGRGEKKDITPLPKGKGARKKRADPQVDPRVKEILDEIKNYFGYPEKAESKDPIPNYGREGQAIKRMFTRGFTREEILACWRSKVSQRGGEFVSMTWVNQDIGDIVRGGEPVPDETKTERGGDTPAKKLYGEPLPTAKLGYRRQDGRSSRLQPLPTGEELEKAWKG